MSGEPVSVASVSRAQASGAVAGLVDFEGSVQAFWPLYLQAVALALGARRVVFLSAAVGQPWQAHSQWPARGGDAASDPDTTLKLLAAAQAAGGRVHVAPQADGTLALAMLPQAGQQVLAVVVLAVPGSAWDTEALCAWAGLAGRVPVQWMQRRMSHPHPLPEGEGISQDQPQSPPLDPNEPSQPHPTAVDCTPPPQPNPNTDPLQRAQTLHDILRLGIRLGNESGFMPLAMALCNQVALRFGCERVSLGWVDSGLVKLTAVSHIENFDARASASRALESAMEEALAQESVVCYPGGAAYQVLRAHQAYAESVSAVFLTTLPITCGDAVVAVLCLERSAAALSADELWALRLLGESVARHLAMLHAQDRWFGARWWQALQDQASRFFTPSHTGLKLTGVVLGVLLAVSIVLPWPYRVDAALSVRSQDLLFMPAPFDGYLRSVQVAVGDRVEAGAVLASLDTRDLLLEAAMAEADLTRYSRETEKALAAQQLADMQVASARQQQSAARLALLRYQLANAEVRAPFAGVVIEGDLKKNLGSPLRKGDLLLKLARTEQTYLELEIDQATIHDVQVGSRAEFALVGRPQARFPIVLTRVDPAASNRDGRTFYLARAELVGAVQADWRAGMGGTARIEVGQRPLIWVLTHRSVRFLREFFWL